MLCPICNGPTYRVFARHDYWIRACEVCGHRTAEIVPAAEHIANTYGDGYFEGGGAGYQDYLSEADILIAEGRRYGHLMTGYTAAGRVLDVGAAAGFVLKGYIESGWRGLGIEPNTSMVEYGCTQLGVPMVTGSLEQFQAQGVFDLVSMIQVIAHFANPRTALKIAAAVTRPGGFWLVETWNRESVTARLFGKHWHEYSPPSVLNWFSPRGLIQLAAECGFREVAHGRPTKWISLAHAKSLVRYKLKESPLGWPVERLARLIPDGLTLPYPGEDLFWMIFQKA
jgi:SAM-dependent methyltransferase